jgi:hypothetical protein
MRRDFVAYSAWPAERWRLLGALSGGDREFHVGVVEHDAVDLLDLVEPGQEGSALSAVRRSVS